MFNRLDALVTSLIDCFGDRAYDVARQLALDAADSEHATNELWQIVLDRIAMTLVLFG